MVKEFLEIGKIVSTHGIRGEVRFECWCNSPSDLLKIKKMYIGKEKNCISVNCRPHKNIAIIKIEGIDTVESAAELRNTVLFIKRSDIKLKNGEHFIQDIIGLDIVDVDSQKFYGKVTNVISTGANDVYEMKDEKSKLFYIPVIKDVVKKIDIEEGKIYIYPMKGLFDDEG